MKREYSDQPVDTILRITSDVVDGTGASRQRGRRRREQGAHDRCPCRTWWARSQDDATQALEELGFVVDDSKTKFSSEVERGHVISQSPADGRLQPGETVSIVTSRSGRRRSRAPDFRSLSRSAAAGARARVRSARDVLDDPRHLGARSCSARAPASAPRSSTATRSRSSWCEDRRARPPPLRRDRRRRRGMPPPRSRRRPDLRVQPAWLGRARG